jgi:phage shock protein A
MTMLNRWRNIFSSYFEKLTDKVENPKLSLEQAIRDLNFKVIEANGLIAGAKAACMVIKEEINQLDIKEGGLREKIKTCLIENNEPLAINFAIELEQLLEQKELQKEAFSDAVGHYKKSVAYKDAYLKLKNQKMQQALSALRSLERAKLLKNIAASMQPFMEDDYANTFDGLLHKIRKETALNQAKAEMVFSEKYVDYIQIEKRIATTKALKLIETVKEKIDKNEQ